MILSHVWEYSFDPQTNIVDVLVSRLRDKIDRPFETKLLHTVRGVGYVLRLSGRPLAFGLRLALWYATLFVVGAIAIVFAHLLPDRGVAGAARSADHRRRSSASTPTVYARGGLRALADTVRAEQRTAPERLFVRVVDRGARGDRPQQPGGLGPVDARDRVAAAGRRHARAGRQEHRGARRSAGAIPRDARPRHAVDRRRSRSPAAGWPRSRRCSRSAG